MSSTDPHHPNPAPDSGWRSLLQDGNALRILVITGGVAIHAVSIYVVATIMPLVVGDVGGVAFYAWTATLYIVGSLCSASAVPLLLSRTGARTIYRLAFLLFLVGSLTCSLATSMPMLLAGRLLQGLGGGMLPALAYTIIRQIFAPALHARAITLVGSVWGIAALLGPFAGGVFAELGAWRAAFWVDVLVGFVFILVVQRALPADLGRTGTARPFPGVRLALLSAAAIAVSMGGATSQVGASLLGLVVAMVLIVLMLRLDARSTPRMLPGGAFDPRAPLGAVSATMGLLILTSAPCTFIPYLLRVGHDVAPLTAGYISALFALSWTAVSLLTGAVGRRGARITIGAGPVLMLAGLALLAWAIPVGRMWLVVLGQVLLGAGIGLGWAHLGALLMAVAPAGERDVAGPFISTTQTLAAVFGSAIAGMVANIAGLATAATPGDIAIAAAWLFGTLTIAPLAACVMAWRTLVLTRAAV